MLYSLYHPSKIAVRTMNQQNATYNSEAVAAMENTHVVFSRQSTVHLVQGDYFTLRLQQIV